MARLVYVYIYADMASTDQPRVASSACAAKRTYTTLIYDANRINMLLHFWISIKLGLATFERYLAC